MKTTKVSKARVKRAARRKKPAPAPGVNCAALPTGVLLYKKPQMAAAMQISVRCLNGLMQRDEIRYLKINHKIVRFQPEEALRRLAEVALVRSRGAGGGGDQLPVTNNQLPVISDQKAVICEPSHVGFIKGGGQSSVIGHQWPVAGEHKTQPSPSPRPSGFPSPPQDGSPKLQSRFATRGPLGRGRTDNSQGADGRLNFKGQI